MDDTTRSCREFTALLGSDAPAPGGGGAAAMAGALGAALCTMVASLTTGKKKYAAVEGEIQELLERCKSLQEKLLDMVAADAEGFLPLTQVYGMAKDDPARPAALQAASETACGAPLRMMELCLKHHVLVVSDEIHSDLIFHGKRHIPTASLSPEIAANVVTGISATKTFNLAGLQASTAVFPNAHMKAMFDKFWTDMDIHRNNAFSVTAMEVAFNEGEEWLEQLLPYISANFDFVVDYCEKHISKIRTYAPDATYLMWLDCRDLGLSNEALHDFMIQKAKLGLNDGCAFGRSLNGYMRLNAACPRSILEQAMRQLEAAVNSL